jgi:AcrR family transcriptional regulator
MDKKSEILHAALKLFVLHGFHATPTSGIAREAGVANGTLFHYFKTKDELIVALYVHIKKQLAFCILNEEIAEATIKEQCKSIYVNALNWGLEHPTEFRFVQQFLSSPYLMMLTPAEIKEQNNMVIELIKEGIATRQIKAIAPDFINSLFISHLFGVNQYVLQTNMSVADRNTLIEESFAMIWGMISV